MTSVKARLLSLTAVLVMGGCATTPLPVSVDYGSVFAAITDTGFAETRYKAQIFALIEIDGQVIINAFNSSRDANYMRGLETTPTFPGRRVPVRPLKLRLRGSHFTAAPIMAIASAATGGFQSVEGTVLFTPREGAFYVVAGELGSARSCVWIEEERTKQPATEKVCSS